MQLRRGLKKYSALLLSNYGELIKSIQSSFTVIAGNDNDESSLVHEEDEDIDEDLIEPANE